MQGIRQADMTIQNDKSLATKLCSELVLFLQGIGQTDMTIRTNDKSKATDRKSDNRHK